MRPPLPRLLLLAAVLAAACAPEPKRWFRVGLLGPLPPRVEAQARRLGMSVDVLPPDGAAVESAAAPGGVFERMAARDRLRFLAARAAVSGAEGVYFRLPAVPQGHDALDYPEDWQALARVARELQAVRPILEAGAVRDAPFAAPPGVSARAWSYGGRTYVLLVNQAGASLPLDPAALAGWRALFHVRADPREALPSCEGGACLPAEGVLWLEGRPRPGVLP